MKLQRGLVQIYTGNGKGKTTAALGQALRACGWDMKVCIIQFVKGYSDIGEIKFIQKYKPNIEIHQFHKSRKPGISAKLGPKYRKPAKKTLEFAQKTMQEAKFDIVILDEILIALNQKLINIDNVLNLIKIKPHRTELILTGRSLPKKLIKYADLITEMKKFKHPYDRKVKARKGIEY